VYATDLARGAVEQTRRQLAFHPDAHVACVDPFSGDWPGGAPSPGPFEVALLSEVLEHIDDDLAMLRSVHGLLARNGRLVITVPAHMALWTPWDVVAGHVRRYERDELLAKLAQAGFVPERVRTWGFPITGWLAIRGSKMRGERVQSRAREIPSLISRVMPELLPLFRLCARVESLFSRTDRGAGYVVVVRKP
jgi:SAM-dependent methyltransferase